MKRTVLTLLCVAAMAGWVANAVAATCDQYPGDNWIYGGVNAFAKSNVLIIIDTSGSMSDKVSAPYKPAKSYNQFPACKTSNGSSILCVKNRVYINDRNSWIDAGFDLSNVAVSCKNAAPHDELTQTGEYTGRSLTASGQCTDKGHDSYALGNWINYNESGVGVPTPKIEIARNVLKDLVTTTRGANLGIMVYNNGNGTSQQSQGSRFFSYPVGGQNYVTTIKDMDAFFSGTTTNRDALLASINTSTIVASGYTPLAESLYEAGQYFRGGASAFGNSVGLSSTVDDPTPRYTSPITSICQNNYIILITDGMSTSDNSAVLTTVCPANNTDCGGDFDGDGKEPTDLSHSLDDVAKYLYDVDLLQDDAAVGKEHTLGKQFVSTYTIGFDLVGANAVAVDLLNRAADSEHGHGAAYSAGDQSELSAALSTILSKVTSVDTSFATPVNPTSSDNRTFSSKRIYMGLFKPDQKYWRGNLKKYGLDTRKDNKGIKISTVIVDKNGDIATWNDQDNNRIDDFSNLSLPSTAMSGTFKTTSNSFWSPTADGGSVEKGGAGGLLDPATRKLYTYNTAAGVADLTNAANRFDAANITPAMLGLTTNTERDKLISFIRGADAYDDNGNEDISEKRAWIMGDVMHSRPTSVSYASYAAGSENDCTANQTMLYVGGNDGMLHAIRDCDGSEAWAFIPPDLLTSLKEIPGPVHTYGVDATPSVYVYDANNDGKIEGKDRVILLFGMRRGGGGNSGSAKGAYYALDVSDRLNPKYLWRIRNNSINDTAGFSELAESWGEPRITKIKIGNQTKIVAALVGGYDNLNEDGRYGATQTFSGTGTVAMTLSGNGGVTSSGTSTQKNPRGRGIYLIELATLPSKPQDSVTITTTPTMLWGIVAGDNTNYNVSPATHAELAFAFAGEVAFLDTAGSGFPDRMYVADLGGNVWRFDIGGSDVSKWRGYKIFSINPSSGDAGRKFFFKPSVTLDATATNPARGLDARIFLGSGDREHPLNSAVVDRMYAMRDRGQTAAKNESDMADVTLDTLQDPNADQNAVNTRLSSLNNINNYGWYIKLDEQFGEKVLAQATVFNKVAYFTTYVPSNNYSSSTSLTVSVGKKNLTVAPGLSMMANQQVIIQNGSNRMAGTISAYDSGTGELGVNITSVVGNATLNKWQVAWGDPCGAFIGNSRLYALNYTTGEAVFDFNPANNNIAASNKRAQSGGAILMRSDRGMNLGQGIASGLSVSVDTSGNGVAWVNSSNNITSINLKRGGTIIPLYWRQK